MHGHIHDACAVRHAPAIPRRERGVRAVLVLAAVTMIAEIVVGYRTDSMALLADGWHMATHVGALAIASLAYVLTRRYANHASFGFGTGKISALAGYTSALALAAAAIAMFVESIQRLKHPGDIDFATSLPVAVVGLVVNLISIVLLEGGEHDHHEHGHHEHGHDGHGHHHHHDANHRAVVLHVLADALTSALAIAALLVGYLLGNVALDAVAGLVGAAVIMQWVISLCHRTSLELLDVDPSGERQRLVRALVERTGDSHVSDLHVWPLGGGRFGCVMTLHASAPVDTSELRARVLASGQIAHVTIEVVACDGEHTTPRRAA